MGLSRRELIAGAAASAAVAFSPNYARSIRPRRSSNAGIIIDGLGVWQDPYAPADQLRISERTFAEIRKTGVTAVRCSTGGPSTSANPWPEALEELTWFDNLFRANPDRLLKVTSVGDIHTAKAAGKLGLILGTQESAMIGWDLTRLAEYKKRGVRAIQLTYNLANLSGDGAIEPRNAGLSNLGRDTIDRIESEQILLDLSHGGARTISEAIKHAKRPLTISHTGCRSLHDHPRNVWDSDLRAMADKGGVVGIYFMPFLTHPETPPTAEDVARHIEHARRVCGEDHVSIGTDQPVLPIEITDAYRDEIRRKNLDRAKRGVSAPGEFSPKFIPLVEELNRVDRFQTLAALLKRRGWTERGLEKLLGGNLLRLYRDAWGT